METRDVVRRHCIFCAVFGFSCVSSEDDEKMKNADRPSSAPCGCGCIEGGWGNFCRRFRLPACGACLLCGENGLQNVGGVGRFFFSTDVRMMRVCTIEQGRRASGRNRIFCARVLFVSLQSARVAIIFLAFWFRRIGDGGSASMYPVSRGDGVRDMLSAICFPPHFGLSGWAVSRSVRIFWVPRI